MNNGPRQNCLFPGQTVVLQEVVARNQSEVQMKMHDPSARFVMTQKAQDRRMTTAGCGRKKLEPTLQEDCLGTVLILFRNKQIEISLARQTSMNPPAALPATVGNVLSMKFVQNHQQQRQDCVLRAGAAEHICLMRSILFHVLVAFRLDDSSILRS